MVVFATKLMCLPSPIRLPPKVIVPNSSSPISVRLPSQNTPRIPPCRFTVTEIPAVAKPPTVAEKLKTLNCEFRSLPEPIERVKRLLQYAALLPQFDDSLRKKDLRVMGCTMAVWLDVKLEGDRVVRFKMDTDSEITKGFCYCLLWLLDGAKVEEVLSVTTDDLMEINVGLSPIRGNSRLNTWSNVLFTLQRRTESLAKQSQFL